MRDIDSWRSWLAENYATHQSIWIQLFKKNSGVESISTSDAVDNALCFGWVDSKINKYDDKSYLLFFSKRNPKSNWSRVNKEKVAKLIEQGLMEEQGLKMINLAKEIGTWDALNDVENLIIPPDLAQEFNKYPNSEENFNNFSRSVKRGILEYILTSKTAPTRQKRIQETAQLASENKKAFQFIRN